MNVLAFVLGFVSIGLVKADVSHLRHNQQQQHQSDHKFVASNGQVVRQSFNSNGDATYSSRAYNMAGNDPNPKFQQQYWWTETNTPFSKTQQHHQHNNIMHNYLSAAGCNGCATRTLNIKHNTQQHSTIQHPIQSRHQNAFINVKHNPSFNRLQTAPVSGSPHEVNSFFAPQSFDSGRVQQTSSSCLDSNSACVAQKFCFNGFIDQSVEHKAVRSSSGRCYAPEVCCRFAQRRNVPFNQDNSVAAAESTSEILTKEGYVVRKPTNQYLPSFPEFNPAPSNDDATFIRPTPPRPAPQRPSTFAPRPSTFAPPRPSTYAPRPTQPQRTQPPPRFNPTPAPQRPIPQRPYQPQPSEIRPIQYEPAPIIIPVGCAAALNCTNIQYCTASGVISKTPVILTPEQEEFRVPMTDCREPTTKEIGKCCRDPDYVDPWPVGRTGQYVPEEINGAFDSGAYNPEQSKIVPVSVKSDGYILPQPSNNQNRLYLPPNSNRI